MFSTGFGFFIFFTISVVAISITIYKCNKTDKDAEIKLHAIKLEEEKQVTERAKISLEKGKLKASGEYVE